MFRNIHLCALSGGMGRFNIENSEFYLNTAGGEGGGAVLKLGDDLNETTLTITGCIFGWNSVEGEEGALGGAVAAKAGAVNVYSTTFQENRGELHTDLLSTVEESVV